uniref:GP-PDE domain-containing protein n=1 Tax=Sphenodon punctatus TaxID=8508 RepID=A0A8D0G3S3_SPHPU
MEEKGGGCRGCATCLLGLYDCRWTHSKKGRRTTKCDCVWFSFLFCTSLFTLAWLYFALAMLNDFHNFNEFIFRMTEWWLDWSVVLLALTALLVTYSTLLLVGPAFSRSVQGPGAPRVTLSCPSQGLLLLTVLLVSTGFVGLELQWAEEWQSASVSLQATGPFLHIGAVAGVTLLAWPVAACFYRSPSGKGRSSLLLQVLSLVASQPPPQRHSLEYGEKGEQGAPAAAPAHCLGQRHPDSTFALHTSDADGVPFLMHDEKLTRTTNVRDHFPARANSNASTFNWTELQQLDAGSWFLQVSRGAGSLLSRQDRARGEHIPSLQEALNETARLNVSIMFDLRPEEAPHYEQLVNITVETILQSAIILWLPDGFREQVKQRAPGFRHVYGLKRLHNETKAPLHVNLPYQNLSSAEIREYRRNNVSVNLYVVNAPWLFSVLWCAGASSVTTNACQVLQQMQRPLWLLHRKTYQMIWIVTDCVSILLIGWAFLLMQ